LCLVIARSPVKQEKPSVLAIMVAAAMFVATVAACFVVALRK
jgi:hypothetical protein